MPALGSDPVLAETFERLGELCNGGRVERWAAAIDRELRLSFARGARISSIAPSGRLWRTAFSITFSTIRVSNVVLPGTSTGLRSVSTASRLVAICRALAQSASLISGSSAT